MSPKPSTELTGLEDCPLHRRTPYVITNVSNSQFSIARYYGGCKFQGDEYVLNPIADELIRKDVLKWKQRRQDRLKSTHDAPN